MLVPNVCAKVAAAVFSLSAGLAAFPDLHAQVSPPLATDVSLSVNTEVSSMIPLPKHKVTPTPPLHAAKQETKR